MPLFRKLSVKNFRAIAEAELPLGDINVLFGPNGVGKSSILDAIALCTELAAGEREAAFTRRYQGMGLMHRGAKRGAIARLELSLAAPPDGSGRVSVGLARTLDGQLSVLDLQAPAGASRVRLYDARRFALEALRDLGSRTTPGVDLESDGANLFAVLRNLQGAGSRDVRYGTILRWMREAFPGFEELLFDQTAPSLVYARFAERGVTEPLFASQMSDGYLHLLVVLTALFSRGGPDSPVVMFDEPDLSLHPWALAVLARAVREASAGFGRQVILATHSPVLLSQFESEACFALTQSHDGLKVTRVDQDPSIADSLRDYALGSLYMAEAIAPQHNAE